MYVYICIYILPILIYVYISYSFFKQFFWVYVVMYTYTKKMWRMGKICEWMEASVPEEKNSLPSTWEDAMISIMPFRFCNNSCWYNIYLPVAADLSSLALRKILKCRCWVELGVRLLWLPRKGSTNAGRALSLLYCPGRSKRDLYFADWQCLCFALCMKL